jgi:hypothetical protein
MFKITQKRSRRPKMQDDFNQVAQQVVMQSTKESKPVQGISHKFPKSSLEASTQRFKQT